MPKHWTHLDYKPAVGKYLTIGPRAKAGSDCPCNKLKSLTSAFSSCRDDCGWEKWIFLIAFTSQFEIEHKNMRIMSGWSVKFFSLNFAFGVNYES